MYGILIAIEGLDGAGKTTILYRLKLGKIVKTIPSKIIILKYQSNWI